LVDLVDEFSDGRIQFAFLKVKDSNSGLPKSVLIGWVWIVIEAPRRNRSLANCSVVWRGRTGKNKGILYKSLGRSRETSSCKLLLQQTTQDRRT